MRSLQQEGKEGLLPGTFSRNQGPIIARLLERRSRILEWQTVHEELVITSSPEVQAAAVATAAEVNALFERKVAEIRAMMAGSN